MMLGGRNSRYPFTASQWQELEHQALIFKYMVSGSPIPPDLIIPIKTSCLLNSNSLYHQPNTNIGWGYGYQLGFGSSKKGEDPEPGRCRRTDGKKWRCSKEAYPESKYCERHMHRGKNRSRKPVEMPSTTTATPTITTTNSSNSFYYSSASYSSHHHSDPKPLGIGHSSQNSLTHFSMDSGSSSDKDYRYLDQYSFLSDASRAEREGPWRFTPLGTSSLGEPRQSGPAHFGTDLLTRASKGDEKHCFVMGTDFKLGRSVDVGRDCDESQRPLRRFLGDRPLRSKEPWMDSEENIPNGDSHTQLSISIPMTQPDFSIAKSHSSSSG